MVRRQRLTRSEQPVTEQLRSAIESVSQPLRNADDLDSLLDLIGEARYVLLGEASHGTHEYYTWRDAISRRLIEEKGFSFIAVEGDWPDCYRVNRYVKSYPKAGDSGREVLHHFERWPTWMWANEEIVEFAEWLRHRNQGHPVVERVGFFGLDVYSLWDSLYQIIGYLHLHRPESLPIVQRTFQCFEPYGDNLHDYAHATRWVDESCEAEVIALLKNLPRLAHSGVDGDWEAHFNAEQNALVVKNAERYYRTMIQGGPESWNIRDRHMTETLERLMRHHGPGAKAIVWEHNTHVGDARYTDMAEDGTVNVGQLVRERHTADGVVLVGFGSYRGSVIARQEWEAAMEWMRVPSAKSGSWEDVLHQVAAEDKMLILAGHDESPELLPPRGHRAIGVVYDPEYELGNYVPTILPRRYDAFLYIDSTEALRPLHEVQPREEGEVPETFPSGF